MFEEEWSSVRCEQDDLAAETGFSVVAQTQQVIVACLVAT